MGGDTKPSTSKVTKSSQAQPPLYQPVPTTATATATATTVDIEAGTEPPPEECPRCCRTYFPLGIALLVANWVLCFFLVFPYSTDNPDLYVKSATVSPFDVSASQISANWTITFSVTNPNKHSTLFYNNIEASVYYGEELLGVSLLKPFYQGFKDQSAIQATFSSDPVTVQNWVASAIVNQIDSSRPISFNVKVESRIRYAVVGSGASWYKIKVSCKDLKIEFSSDTKVGTMPGGPKKCEVSTDEQRD